MKILIVSDSHGRCHYLRRAYEQVSPVDMLIHLGDLEGDEAYISEFADCTLSMVSGNNDYFTDIPRDLVLQVGRYHIFLTHGHRYGVNYDTESIKEAAAARGANIVMYGHTHRPVIDMSRDDVWAINPGSISLPRQEGGLPSFILMEIDNSGEAHFTINYIRGKM